MPDDMSPSALKDEWESLSLRSWHTLTDDEKMRRLRATFYYCAVSELERAASSIQMGAYILGFCALDWLSTLAIGKESGYDTFKPFCLKYLCAIDNRYDVGLLWQSRCGLVHNYSLRYGYALGWGPVRHRDLHLAKGKPPGRPGALNLERFIADIAQAGERMFIDASTDDALRGTMIDWADKKRPFGLSMEPTT